jgi:hypothetical protein
MFPLTPNKHPALNPSQIFRWIERGGAVGREQTAATPPWDCGGGREGGDARLISNYSHRNRGDPHHNCVAAGTAFD